MQRCVLVGHIVLFCDGLPERRLHVWWPVTQQLQPSIHHATISIVTSSLRKVFIGRLNCSGWAKLARFARKIAKTRSFLHEVCCGLCQSTVCAGLLDSYPGVTLAVIVEGANFVASVKGQQPQLQDKFLLACNHLNLHFPNLYKMGSVQRSTSWLRRMLFINIFDHLKFLVQYITFSDTELMMFIMSICSGNP